jgi:dTDP-4-dehydrorhamnose 3,5-epimerase
VGNTKRGEGKKLIAVADRTDPLLSVHAARAAPHEVSLIGEPLEAGLAHGFLVTSDAALFAYKRTVRYNAEAEASVLWNDPQIGIEWPVERPVLSEKDRSALPLAQIASRAAATVRAVAGPLEVF